MNELFESILYERDLKTLPARLENLEATGMSMDKECLMYMDNYRYPIAVVVDTIKQLQNDDTLEYLTEVLFWVTERTTPTQEILELLISLYNEETHRCVLKAMDELLKKYEGNALPWSEDYELMELVLGYGYIDVASLYTVFDGSMSLLPVEEVMAEYVYVTVDIHGKFPEIENMLIILKKAGSPDPSPDVVKFRCENAGMNTMEQRFKYAIKQSIEYYRSL
jgi:hypothetical protein